MKRCLLLVLVALDVAAQPGKDLVPVRQDNDWIFIDSKGHQTGAGKYKNAGYFSEGLAAVRIGGRFGYIDTSGKVIVPNFYDYAGEFKDGLATVVLNGRPSIIDRNGQTIYQPEKNSQFNYGGSKHVIVRSKDRAGLYSLEKGTILKTRYRRIEPLSDSLFVVIKSGGGTKNSSLFHLSKGFILPFGNYREYHANADGSISFQDRNDTSQTYVVVDQWGHTIMRANLQRNVYPDVEYSEGYAIVNFYGDQRYENYMDATGKMLFGPMVLERASAFSEGRAFVKFRGKEWQIIDKNGKLILNQEYSSKNDRFQITGDNRTPVCVVEVNSRGWGVIDASGSQLIPAVYQSIEWADTRRGYFLASIKDRSDTSAGVQTKHAEIYRDADHAGDDSLKNMQQVVLTIEKERELDYFIEDEKPKYLFGLIDQNGRELLPFKYRELYPLENPDVYYFADDSTSGLIGLNRGVIYLFEEASQRGFLDTLDIDYMERGYCYAGSAFYIENELGGHASSFNSPRIGASQFHPGLKGVFLWIDTLRVDTFYKRFAGHPLFLGNRSNDTVVLDAQDGRLYMTMQAFYEGEWKDIEYSPNSWCGNSYHEVGLLEGQYWKFTAPVYKGSIPVKLRYCLVGQKQWNSRDKKYELSNIVYSNTFYGSVNPAQFWKKKGHSPSGIMDPYNE